MPAKARLGADERRFLAVVTEAAYMNPFSAEQKELLNQAAPGGANFTAGAYSLVPEMESRIAFLDQRGLKKLEDFVDQDRPVIEAAYLYQAYHRFIDDFDRLITRQVLAGASTVEAPFAQELLAQLVARGVTAERGLGYIGLFFQLRRAYYFIVVSLIGDSPSMGDLRLALWDSVFTHDMHIYERHLRHRMEDFSTLLLGETGTGKGSAAAAIGRSGFIPYDPKAKRFTENFAEAFVAINLSQFPETLIESELFGHRRGSFTGAVDDHKGLFERCSSAGALFLDEIGEVSVPVQIKLLHVLQERTFTPVGSHKPGRFFGRVIAATNRSLAELREGGRFRDDFFYRLCSDVIFMPSLRQRIAESATELQQLVGLIVSKTTGAPDEGLADRVLAALRQDLPGDYAWPGNVRELEQAVRRVLLTGHYAGDARITDDSPEPNVLRLIREGTATASQLLAGYCAALYRRHGTYGEVARRVGLDRRTVRRYVMDRSSER